MKVQKTHYKIIFLFLFWGFIGHTVAQDSPSTRLTQKAQKRLQAFESPFSQWKHLGIFEIDSVDVREDEHIIWVYFSNELSYIPVREEDVEVLESEIKDLLKHRFRDYSIKIITGGYEMYDLVPNVFRNSGRADSLRLPRTTRHKLFVRRLDQPFFEEGLSRNHIALWPSHGYYFERKLDRWEWQRARLYSTVEDLLPMSFVYPFLVPMLENAGACVLTPRERDMQEHEVLVDNDCSSEASLFELLKKAAEVRSIGFARMDTLFPGDNPFNRGTSLMVNSRSDSLVARFTPCIPSKGEYAVYVAYAFDNTNSGKVTYSVRHRGGVSAFEVDQSVGGGTWVYLGTFSFAEGLNPLAGAVEIRGQGQVSVDAVRFGGGIGNVARKAGGDSKWQLSGKPRYMEGARYWLQYAGMPDSLVFNFNKEQNDYIDDYVSRGEWLNYLMGSPGGPQSDRLNRGLGIPVDMALAFHTDAGVTPNDSTIGTLGIFSTVRDGGLLPDGQSRLASRDLADVVISQLVDDIRLLHNPQWTRRALWDKQYSEAWRPNVPTLLLELLSHQNLADMRLALDPQFQFNVSRAIYKGILKYLAYQEGRSYQVQPLPVNHMAIRKVEGGYELSWHAVDDPLEESAGVGYYKVYQRVGNGSFDNGTIVDKNRFFIAAPEKDTLLSFKVTALNKGGESMPSEILALGLGKSEERVLVVNAFDRVSAPAIINGSEVAGIAYWEDEGVSQAFDFGYTGRQYDFKRQSPWLDDDSPGWGASYGDEEGRARPGNSFDFVSVHGKAIMEAGYSFVSVSDEAFENQNESLAAYFALDIILGEEKPIHRPGHAHYDFAIFTPGLIKRLRQATNEGVSCFLSGAYVGSDLILRQDSSAMDFASRTMGFQWRTSHASRNGCVKVSGGGRNLFIDNLVFNTGYDPYVYKVEAPDAIEPAQEARTVLRYSENNMSAGVFLERNYKTLILGFPFESIQSAEERAVFMKNILDAFKEKKSE